MSTVKVTVLSLHNLLTTHGHSNLKPAISHYFMRKIHGQTTLKKIMSLMELSLSYKIRLDFSLMYFTWNMSVTVHNNLTV